MLNKFLLYILFLYLIVSHIFVQIRPTSLIICTVTDIPTTDPNHAQKCILEKRRSEEILLIFT